MIDFEKMVEDAAESIWQADDRIGAQWKEMQGVAYHHPNGVAKRAVDTTRKQARAALKAALRELPFPYVSSGKRCVLGNILIKCQGEELYDDLLIWAK